MLTCLDSNNPLEGGYVRGPASVCVCMCIRDYGNFKGA